MTSHPPESFIAMWSDLEPRLRGFLRSRLLPEWAVDDVIQDTAFRLLMRWKSVDKQPDLFPLAATIAINLARDEWRRAKTQVLVDELLIPGPDPQDEALARLEWSRVMLGLKALIPRYRDLLLAEAGLVANQPAGTAANNARMRARRRLRHILEHGVPVALPSLGLRERWTGLRAWLARKRSGSMSVLAPDGVAAFVLCALAALSGAVETMAPATPHTPRSPESDVGTVEAAQTDLASGDRVAWSRSGTAMRRSTAGARTDERDEHGPSREEAALQLPRVRSRGGGMQSFGAHGYDISDKGDVAAAGERLTWEQSHSARTPRCVEDAASGRISTDCSGGQPPEGEANVQTQGQRTRIRYGP